MDFVSRHIFRTILAVALALEFVTVQAQDAAQPAIELQWPSVQEGEYRDLVWYRKLKLDVAGYLSPEIVDRSAVLYKYQLADISDEACDNVAKWLTSGWLAFAMKADDADNTYQVFVPPDYQEFLEEQERLEDTIFSRYRDVAEYATFVEEAVLPEYRAVIDAIRADSGDPNGSDDQEGIWQHAAYAIADTVGARVAGAYREFFSNRNDQDYERYVSLRQELRNRPLFDENNLERSCLPQWVDTVEWDADWQRDALLFLGVTPDLFEGHSVEKMITWNAGNPVVPTEEVLLSVPGDEDVIASDFLENIGKNALRY